MKPNELFKQALYLLLMRINDKLLKFNKNKFILQSSSICKCYILDYNAQYINVKYKNLFRNCGIECNNVKYYIYIKPLKRNSEYAFDYEFFIIDTNTIRKLYDVWNKNYKQNVKSFTKSYYKFEYNVLKSNGLLLKF